MDFQLRLCSNTDSNQGLRSNVLCSFILYNSTYVAQTPRNLPIMTKRTPNDYNCLFIHNLRFIVFQLSLHSFTLANVGHHNFNCIFPLVIIGYSYLLARRRRASARQDAPSYLVLQYCMCVYLSLALVVKCMDPWSDSGPNYCLLIHQSLDANFSDY
jgi:hypothetical protein